MALNLEDKKAIVAGISEIASGALSAIAAEYRGSTVSVMNALRKNARKSKVSVGVYRNTLAKRAFQDTQFACLSEVLTGPIVLLFSQDDPGAAARVLRDFEFAEQLTVRGLALSGKLLPANQLKAVASLPTMHEALTQLVAVMKAPITKFVRTLNEVPAKTTRVFHAVGEKKKVA